MVSLREAARRLHAPINTLRYWCHRGWFPRCELRQEARGLVWYVHEGDLALYRPRKRGPKPRSITE